MNGLVALANGGNGSGVQTPLSNPGSLSLIGPGSGDHDTWSSSPVSQTTRVSALDTVYAHWASRPRRASTLFTDEEEDSLIPSFGEDQDESEWLTDSSDPAGEAVGAESGEE